MGEILRGLFKLYDYMSHKNAPKAQYKKKLFVS